MVAVGEGIIFRRFGIGRPLAAMLEKEDGEAVLLPVALGEQDTEDEDVVAVSLLLLVLLLLLL